MGVNSSKPNNGTRLQPIFNFQEKPRSRIIRRLPRQTPQRDVVFMPQPPTGEMATKMASKTEDNRVLSKQSEIEAGIQTSKKPLQPTNVPKSVSAANPISGTQLE